jgi:cob(I)alamin adenosyltransferase
MTPEVITYLNRLSDLLFVLARAANGDGGEPNVDSFEVSDAHVIMSTILRH